MPLSTNNALWICTQISATLTLLSNCCYKSCQTSQKWMLKKLSMLTNRKHPSNENYEMEKMEKERVPWIHELSNLA